MGVEILYSRGVELLKIELDFNRQKVVFNPQDKVYFFFILCL